MRCHSGEVKWEMWCASLISLERRQSKAFGRQVLELDFGEQEVNVPCDVAEDTVCSQTPKDRLDGSLSQAIASRVVGHCLMHLNPEAMCQLLPCLGLQQLVSIGNDLSRTSFESDHFSKEHVDEVISRDVLAAWYKHSTLRKSVDHGHNSVVTSHGWRQPRDPINRHAVPLGVRYQ